MAENRQRFYYDYEVDEDNSLHRAIWADRNARRNYSLFADAVSYDPTYSSNKYDMIFTPFTGVDHHKRGKGAHYIITDQDPGIIKAVPLAFKSARHWFCMWHIMNKVLAKFGVTRVDYKEFLQKLNDIIWDDNQ
ncbi:protein FAR1-RELATED SEQUENCE 5-like [Silene latifolia]|uniref:protein FAR1-RELATED SEQUENCE 5-like n=1 Tax=Silene latifolia TaxID=37657 RepID=UPI003D77B922